MKEREGLEDPNEAVGDDPLQYLGEAAEQRYGGYMLLLLLLRSNPSRQHSKILYH